MCLSCRSRKTLKNEYLVAKFGFDTAKNEPRQVLHFLAGKLESEIRSYTTVFGPPKARHHDDPGLLHAHAALPAPLGARRGGRRHVEPGAGGPLRRRAEPAPAPAELSQGAARELRHPGLPDTVFERPYKSY